MRLGLGLLVATRRRGGPTASPPVNTVLPAITGTARAGETLSCSTGTWTNAPTGYAYQWKAGGADIDGATASTYELTSGEIGAVITCTVMATNAGGSAGATSAGTAAVLAAFTPLALPSLNRWYDFSDAATFTIVSGEVDAVADKSGNAYTISAPSSSRRANTTTINSVAALTFNQDYLTGTAGLTAFNGNDLPFTFFAVIQPANVSQDPGDLMTMKGSNANQIQRVFQNAVPVFGLSKTDSAPTTKAATGAGIDTSPQIVSVICTGTTATVRRNGVAIATGVDVDVATMTVNRFTLAANYNGSANSNFFIGKIGEAALCSDDLGSPDVADMEAYLAAKWSISI